MSRIGKLVAVVADLKARRLAEGGAGIAAEALEAIGCRVVRWPTSEGISVLEQENDAHLDAARDAKLAELRAKGIDPLVVFVTRLGQEPANVQR